MDESQHERAVYGLLTEAGAHASIYHSHWLCSTNINGYTNDLEKDEIYSNRVFAAGESAINLPFLSRNLDMVTQL